MTVDKLIEKLSEMRNKYGNVDVKISVSDQMGGWLVFPDINVGYDTDIDCVPCITIIDNDDEI